MYIEDILQHQVDKVALNKTFHGLTQTESQPEYAQQEGLNISDLAIALSPLSFVFIWAIFLFIVQKLRSHADNKIAFSVNGLHQVPCKNCKFFSNNHYLKCAVRPDIVLTEEAMNCSEYCPKKGKFTPNKLFR
ncbi:hypothetical protein PN497_21680 [Sphaerospermopsis kisseleviana CS-549]|jgi:hypothetical protein|uniref:Uncharacterized protein n=2 Tax=Sphaerospermopsis TaxID=752201 RepID=A0A479ZY81_9CYAN|nr:MULTISPECIES: hypothetical protein [Sphaerospermopsis]BAZ79528.1 hypothetical protein NIES73_07720 [Sphaerospermopsis kisseleviana NIES-73]MBD2131951.1 hypothetical protein [Sphaerospermopsis sp. FACHB-1094]MBD2146807.1 hypothetical protein [Sphaerospermopsis sp. FACHB-1194]MDB9443940.1 hypothetical protein [Sphaerospermopsis kisseleviana CS-549]GCL37740.1 hypothetical protein SR1949_28520 [Sphaerospermopsis reniformis]